MKQPKKLKARSQRLAVDQDQQRFEARLHQNGGLKEPRVPAMTATKGKRTKFTGMTAQGTVAALKAAGAGRKKSRP